MACYRNRLLTIALTALVVASPCAALGQNVSKAKGITRQQADEILDELKQIHALLERLEKEQGARAAGNALNSERVKVKVDGSYAAGKEDAPVTLVEFADYQCPYCRQFHAKVFEQLRANYIDTGRLRFVALDLPLEGHEYASKAATAALCAGEQFKFWEMRDVLLTSTTKLSEEEILDDATELHLDSGLFRTCLASDRYARKLSSDATQAAAIGISGTPSFVLGKTAKGEIEGIKIVGTLPYEDLVTKIEGVLLPTP